MEVLKTFVYYKPQYVGWSIAESMRVNFHGEQARAVIPDGPRVVPYPRLSIGLLLASMACALACFVINSISLAELRRIAGVTLLSACFTLPSYLAVWAMPHTSGDLLLYCIFALGLAVGAALSVARWSFARADRGPRRPEK